jgi:phosphatidylglycerol:prolipoprotein diacylglycerol transferase
MQTLMTISWDMERGLDLGFLTLRYYSLLFAGGFVLGYFLMKKMFRDAGVTLDKLDTLLTYVVIATIVGARLGHVFFYEWDYYSQHPGEILKVWKGGLASHGAAVAIIIAVIIYSRRVLNKSSLWMLDRLVITVALAGALIRLGNWFNSEIYGEIANSSLQTVFLNPPRERLMDAFPYVRDVEFKLQNTDVVTDSVTYPVYFMRIKTDPDQIDPITAEYAIQNQMMPYINGLHRDSKNIIFPDDFKPDFHIGGTPGVLFGYVYGVPRYPTQIFEAFGYFFIFLILYRIYLVQNLSLRRGFIFGMFLILVFGFRFYIEYYKEVQVTSELGDTLNLGQKLSIPLVLAGIFFSVMALVRQKE